MDFNIKLSKSGEYYIVNKDKCDYIYDQIINILKKYNKFYEIMNNLNLYEYLYNFELSKYHNDPQYKSIYEEFIYYNNKYIFKHTTKDNITTLSIMKYNCIDKQFTSYYEVFNKISKYINKSSINNVLEITNTYIGSEALHFYSQQNFINNTYDFYIPTSTSSDKEIYNRLHMITDIINGKNRHRYVTLLDKLNNNKKYDIILNSVRPKNKYYTSCYWIYATNRIKILYLLESLLLLKQDGILIIPFYFYRTNIQKEIYYLFRKLFKKTKLFIPESNNVYFGSAGYLIGINYLDIKLDITNIIKQLNELDDDIYIENHDICKNFNDYNNIVKYYIDNKDNNKYGISSFYNIIDNKEYNNKLEKYFNQYYEKYREGFNRLNMIISDKELFNLKILKAIEWCKKYKFDIQEDLNYTLFIEDKSNEIYDYILEFNKNTKLASYKYTKINKEKKITLEELSNKIIKLNNIHEIITNYIDTRDTRIYRKVRLEFDYYYHKIKNIKLNIHKRYLNQPFFKMYEMLDLYKLLDNKSSYKTFFFCELPGSFIYSIDYYIKTRTEKKDFYWKAQSLNEENNIAKLEDTFDMLTKFKNRYDFGPKNNGNLLYDYNLDYYLELIIKEKYDMIIADCGSPLNNETCNDMNNLESTLLLLILKTQKNGIIKIVYPFQNNQNQTIIMIGIITKYYKDVYFYKSEQAYTSNEFYLVFKDFYNKDKDYDEIIKTQYNNIMSLTKYLDDYYYYRLYKIYKRLINIKIEAIKYKLYLLDRYEIIKNNTELYNKINNHIKEIQDKWIKRFGIK